MGGVLFSLWAVWLLALLPDDNVRQSQAFQSMPTVDQLIDSLSLLSASTYGKRITFAYETAENPNSPYAIEAARAGYTNSRSTVDGVIETDPGGEIRRTSTRYSSTHDYDGKEFASTLIQDSHARNGLMVKSDDTVDDWLIVSAKVDENGILVAPYIYVDFALGISTDDSMFLRDILSEGKCSLTQMPFQREAVIFLECEHPTRGTYRLWFRPGTVPLPIRFELIKSSHHLMYGPNHDETVGSALSSPRGRVLSYRRIVDNIEYEDVGGTPMVRSYSTSSDVTDTAGPHPPGTETRIEFDNSGRCETLNAKRISFITNRIPDGQRVFVQGEENIRFELHGGVIYKILDSGALVSLDGIAFEPSSFWLRYRSIVGVLVLVLLTCTVLVIRRQRRRLGN